MSITFKSSAAVPHPKNEKRFNHKEPSAAEPQAKDTKFLVRRFEPFVSFVPPYENTGREDGL